MTEKRIMVVEDENLTMMFITETLEEFGCKDILEYACGQDIIDSVKNGIIPDLILMDINIKGAKDGIQTATEVLQFCNTPIIFMSAYNDNKTISEVLNVSLYGFISKPFNERELYIALQLAIKNFSEKNTVEEKRTKTKIELYDNCYYDLETESLYLFNNLITLPYNQRILLETLVKNINVVVSKESLASRIWGIKEESSSGIRTVIYLLRKNLKGIEISSQSKQGYILKAKYL
ncbi:MAG: Two-component hybrid sensor and regulator [uncultured Sulfurovum sp.]|uniref:Two-component hybrid sensor and regulator n=1 Tax=uncultured Sulfurovum sp. TaxID=269237 RepID=A0A6S6THX3_9BACT|nr:MAG: Two-component hybrid sensor and regulator [uncultured Sulfurovum sp.]